MSNLLYLGAAVLISAIGGLVLYLRNRRPRSLAAGIEEFRRELRALTPDRPPDRPPGPGTRDPRNGRGHRPG